MSRWPALKVPMAHVALALLRVTAPQPLIVAPSAVNPTLPVGALPATTAVNDPRARASDGLPELVSVVVDATLAVLSVTLSMKVVLSVLSVPVNAMVCAPVVVIEIGILTLLKLALAGDSPLPSATPSTLTWIGCTKGETQQFRRAACNESVYPPAFRLSTWLMLPVP